MTHDDELERAGLPCPLDSRVRTVLAVAVDRYRDPGFTVPVWAARTPYSFRRLQELIETDYGMPPAEVLMRLRVFAARELILSGSARSMRAAAAAVGARSQGHFTTRYEELTGRRAAEDIREARWGRAADELDTPGSPDAVAASGALARLGIGPAKDERVARALRFIVDHYRESITIAQVAEHARASERWLQAAAEAAYGVAPLEIQQRLRLHAARDMMQRGEVARVRDAAHAVGHPHLGRFSVRYRALFGESPSATLAAATALGGRIDQASDG